MPIYISENQNMTAEELKAATYIKRMYLRITGQSPILRYSRGVIQYPFPEVWLNKNKENLDLLCRLVRKVVTKYPDLKCTFCVKLTEILFKHIHTDITMAWYHGYFIRVCEEHREELERLQKE